MRSTWPRSTNPRLIVIFSVSGARGRNSRTLSAMVHPILPSFWMVDGWYVDVCSAVTRPDPNRFSYCCALQDQMRSAAARTSQDATDRFVRPSAHLPPEINPGPRWAACYRRGYRRKTHVHFQEAVGTR